MNGFRAMLRKEFLEVLHTWRIAVVPGFLLVNAVASPVLAMLAPRLLASSLGPAAAALPDPTAADAYAQWTKNLTPMALLLLVIIASGAIGGEVAHGTATMVLTKPVSRPAFVLAKFVAAAVLVSVATTLGTLVTWAVTAAIFPGAGLQPVARASAAWVVFALFAVAVAFAWSALLSSTLAAAGAGLGTLAVLVLAGLWGPASRHSPAGLGGVVTALALGHDTAALWPVLTTAAATVLVLALAAAVLQRREI